MKRVRWMATVLLLALALPSLLGALPVRAQDVTPIELDQAHFGVAQVQSLAAGAEAVFSLALRTGDRVVMDLQGENDSFQVTQFAASYGALELQSLAPASYLAWAPEDGDYTVTVKNSGDVAAGFALRVVASPAPLPTKKVLTADADGQTIPVTVGEPFQVVLDAAANEGYVWTVQTYNTEVLKLEGSDTILLGTMPQAMSQQIFTFSPLAPGTEVMRFDYSKNNGGVEQGYSVTVAVLAPEGEAAAAPGPTPVATPTAPEEAAPVAEEPAPQPLALDDSGKAQAAGSLEPQGMAAYAVTVAAGAQVQAAITPADTGMILTVVGADGVPLLTDHAGASNFDQTVPAEQVYTFKVINFGEGAQEYTFDINVTAAASTEETETAAPILPEPIALDQGAVLVIPLAGTPTTGYIWQVKPSAEGILSARGDAAFTATSDMPGAGGYEIFTFDAVGAGPVTLTFTHSQPWDETTPPEQVIDLPFVVNAPAVAAEPPAPPAPVEIGEADNGGSVEVQVGGMLFVNLPGNPTTGYIWQIENKDDTLLEPTDYAFQPDSDLTGAGGVEHFEFKAVAPGEVTLQLAQSRPWETDAEPVATFSVTVKIGEAPAN